MNNLITTVKQSVTENSDLPFSVYSSVQVQNLLNVPIVKPLLIAVLDGNKELGKHSEIVCQAGDFIFLSDNPAINMRNIPKDREYFALLIEFDFEDFEHLQQPPSIDQNYCVGKITQELEMCLSQFVEWARFSPSHLWSLRKQEIIQLLYHMGHKDISSIAAPRKVGQKVYSILVNQPAFDTPMEDLCDTLAMSESTLRRKLKSEGTSIQEIKDHIKLGLGLHLLQTTRKSVAFISEQCGYQSQSRFTGRFKDRFGLTPSELRKTKLTE